MAGGSDHSTKTGRGVNAKLKLSDSGARFAALDGKRDMEADIDESSKGGKFTAYSGDADSRVNSMDPGKETNNVSN